MEGSKGELETQEELRGLVADETERAKSTNLKISVNFIVPQAEEGFGERGRERLLGPAQGNALKNSPKG